MKAVFLDRDGVINIDRDDYVKSIDELRVFSFAPEAIRRICDAGWLVFVVSNQQAISKGIISEDTLVGMEKEIAQQIEDAGGKIIKFYYCRHLASENCSCRKPQPGLILTAAKDHGIDLAKSIMVGDSERDIIAGKTAGCRTILALTGKLTREDVKTLSCTPDFIVNTLAEAAEIITHL